METKGHTSRLSFSFLLSVLFVGWKGYASSLAVVTLLNVICGASSLAAQQRDRPIREVAIIGGGIAGLSLSHAIQNIKETRPGSESINVSLFESRKELDFVGGSGVQLNGGLAMLGEINPSLQAKVIKAGLPILNLRGKSKSWFESKLDRIWDYSIPDLISNAGEATRDSLTKPSGEILWCGIMRGALLKVLYDDLKKDSVDLQCQKSLVDITSVETGGICHFSDGSTAGPFDLIVGTDGIKSGVKEYIEAGKVTPSSSDRKESAVYSGIRITYAVQDGQQKDNEPPDYLQQTFADGAYVFEGTFGNGADQPGNKCAFVISLDDQYNGPFKRKDNDDAIAIDENTDWAQDISTPADETRRRLLQLVEKSNVPVSENLVSIAKEADRFFELGVYFHNPFSFAGWSKEIPDSTGSYTVLCGDSAHAMPPFLGQGANQAIQDAYLLSEKIATLNSQVTGDGDDNKSLKSLLREYEGSRWFPTTSITVKAAILGYLETGGRNGFYAKFRDVFFKILVLVGVPEKVLLDAATPKVK